LKNVNKYYGKHHVLKDINLTIKDGEKLVIIGPSGSGKSTTIRCMNGLEEVSSGEVIVGGIPLN
ncbi:ATP-binding cassette domain-containing protein, partial [Helicobacter cinaedi]